VRVDLSAPRDLKVLGRPAELRRVFQNLLDNAVKFSPQAGVVEVRLFLDDTSTSAQGARLEVLDRGPGVPSALRPRLFGRFSHGRAGGGSGLGLYLARQIVTEHGGEILYSSREGGGSRFTVFLPIAREAVTS
jgi:signal transduction histidine kinase